MFKDVHSEYFLIMHPLEKDNKYTFILETLEAKEKHRDLSFVKFKVDFQNGYVC